MLIMTDSSKNNLLENLFITKGGIFHRIFSLGESNLISKNMLCRGVFLQSQCQNNN